MLDDELLAFKNAGSYGANKWREKHGNDIDRIAILSAVASYRWPQLSREFAVDRVSWNSIPGKTRLNHRWEKFAEQCWVWVQRLNSLRKEL